MHTEPFPPLIRNDCLIETSSELFILAEWRCSGQPGRPSPPTPSATAAVQPDLVQLCLWCAAACRPAAAWADPQARRRRIEANSAPLAMNLLPMVQKFSTVFARIAERVTQKAKKREKKKGTFLTASAFANSSWLGYGKAAEEEEEVDDGVAEIAARSMASSSFKGLNLNLSRTCRHCSMGIHSRDLERFSHITIHNESQL